MLSPGLNRAAFQIPPDSFVCMLIKTSAVAEQNTLRLPEADFRHRRLRLTALQEQRQSHPEKDPAVWVIHSRELCGSSPRLSDLVQFDVDDRVGEYQRL